MKWFLPLLLLAVPCFAQQQGTPPVEFPIPTHTKGLNTLYSPNRLDPGQATVLRNAYMDDDIGLIKRNGYYLYGTIPGCASPILGGWSYTSLSGTEFHFLQCGGQLYESNGDGTYTALGMAGASTTPLRETNALGYAWFSNGIDNVFYTDGVALSSVTTAPQGQVIGTFQNRVVLANISAGNAFSAGPSSVWLSGFDNGSDYVLPAVAVDTNAVVFGLNGLFDTRSVNCIFGGFKNVLLLWNGGQMWGLYGSGQSSFILNLLSNEVGCIEQGTVQEYNGKLRWLSKRGLEEYNGTNLTSPLISRPIQDQINAIVTSQQKTVSLIHSDGDWAGDNPIFAGAGAPISATILPGSVVPDTWSYVDPITTGTLASVTTSWLFGPVSLLSVSYSSQSFKIAGGGLPAGWTYLYGDVNGDASLGVYNDYANSQDSPSRIYTTAFYANPTWPLTASFQTYYAANTNDNSCSPSDRSATLNQVCAAFKFLRTSDNDYYSLSIESYNKNNNATKDLYLRKFVGGVGSVLALSSVTVSVNTSYAWVVTRSTSGDFVALQNGTEVLAASDGSAVASNSIELDMNKSCTDFAASCGHGLDIVNFISSVAVQPSNVPKFPPSGVFTSQIFDTGFSTPVGGPIYAIGNIPSNTAINFFVRQSSSTQGVWSAWTAVSTGSQIGLNKEFWQYSSTLTTVDQSTTPYLSAVGLMATTTGVLVTTCFNPGASITGWGAFQAFENLAGGGAISFFVSTGDTCGKVEAANANWSAQPSNTFITVATSSYLGVKAIFSVTMATDEPILSGITVNYLSGLGRPAAASVTFHRRYYLAYSTSIVQGAFNDHILAYDMNGVWSQLDDIDASSMFTYGFQWYTGSSRGDGKVFLQDTGQTDGGSYFTFDFQSPDIEFNSPFYLHDLDDLYVEGKGTVDPAVAGTLSVNYYVDGGTTPYSLGGASTLQNERGYFYNRYAFPVTGAPTKVHSLRLEYLNSDQSPLTIHQSMIRFWPELLP